ncbi:MAG: nuclear transport factor 2 family protein [Ktedonobacterales bacterium]|nr:nuclear transport factor 2 family protein [Ktedonobacterales bacterium]
MLSDAERHDQEEIRQLLATINKAWLHGQAEDLARCLHTRMVIVHPGAQARVSGRQACVESYQEFTNQATIHSYDAGEATIDIWGETGVATSRFEITYTMDGTHYHDIGHDLFVFEREEGRWWAIWRTLLPDPAGA